MPKNAKRRLRKRDVERLENTSVAAAIGPSDACTCATTSAGDPEPCAVASCAVSGCIVESGGAAG